MMPFFQNWKHFVEAAGLEPVILGAADVQMYQACTRDDVAALTLSAGLDVWNYTVDASVSRTALTVVQNGSSEWKYYRHHKSSFLEIGLVKAAFLWELLRLGYDVLISDLDVVWLRGGWERWMTYRNPRLPPLPEARLMAMADVLVSTDELDTEYDAHGTWNRWPFGVGWGWRAELNTGVVHFRATNGSLAFVQAWRRAMLAKRNVEHTNDQFVFCAMVRDAQMEPVTSQAAHLDAWRASLGAHGLLRDDVLRQIGPSTRGVSISKQGFQLATPCLPEADCAPTRFTLGTLPLRVFTGGHTYFMQRVQNFEGHARPKHLPLTVHFTFQYSDTPDFPHGKRQRAREAGLWAVDPPAYFTEGTFVRVVGPLYTAAQREAIFRRWPEWSPQRHMHLDAIQRAATRDLLALSIALNASMIMPPFQCACDRYWGFTENCRMPTAPQEMPFPFRCSQDALFEIKYWNDKGVAFREADFLDHPSVPPEIEASAVRVVVEGGRDVRKPPPGSADAQDGGRRAPRDAPERCARRGRARQPVGSPRRDQRARPPSTVPVARLDGREPAVQRPAAVRAARVVALLRARGPRRARRQRAQLELAQPLLGVQLHVGLRAAGRLPRAERRRRDEWLEQCAKGAAGVASRSASRR